MSPAGIGTKYVSAGEGQQHFTYPTRKTVFSDKKKYAARRRV
jgi:hypothetical protein